MPECSVVIKSTDSFSDVWGPCLECLKRYWPDCPWPIRTTSETQPWGSMPLLTERNYGWVGNMSVILEKADSEFVLLFLDDMLLCEPVRTEECVAALELMKSEKSIGAVRLGPGPETYEPIQNTLFAIIKRHSEYRISTSPTLWRTTYLQKVLSSGVQTPWEFEIKGTTAAVAFPEDVYIVNKFPRPFQVLYSAITRGEFEAGAIAWLNRVGIEVHPNRPITGVLPGQRWPK